MNPRDRRSKLWRIRDVAEVLRSEQSPTPDLTSAILDRVDAQRPFLAPSVRRRVPWVYASVAASISACVLAVVLVHRASPTALQLAGEPAPISTLANSVECAACRKLDALRQSIAGDTISAPSPQDLLTTVAAVASVIELESAPFHLPDQSPRALAAAQRPLPVGDTQAVAIIGHAPMPWPVPGSSAEPPRSTGGVPRFASASSAQSIVPSPFPAGEPLPRAALFAGDLRSVRLGTHPRSQPGHDPDLFILPR